jgi:FKBP-type peptidyl-prolyl cis-trans isomerase FkpA
MTEITRVPLAPIAKGALTKLWLGVAAAALAAGGVVWASMPPGVSVETVTAGKGASPGATDVVTINYKGTLPDGSVFDEGKAAKLPMTGIIPGFVKALEKMQVGGKYKTLIPAEMAYGKEGAPGIPPNTDLTFEIELLKIQPREQAEAEMRAEQMKAAEAAEAEAKKGGKKAGAGDPAGEPRGGIPDPSQMQGAPGPQ